jgi:hypothetical protein
MSTNATKPDGLDVGMNLLNEALIFEDPVISVVGVDGNAGL